MELAQRPRLAPKARLHFDRHSSQHLILYPEKGLALNATGAAVVKLCTGDQTITEIVDALSREWSDAPRARIEQEVLALLEQLERRGLLQSAP
jgi:coenzyme PQQ biosynthesis protein PqqD